MAAVQRCLDDRCSAADAVAWMRRAGTDPHYTGLYAAPKKFRPLTREELARVASDFPEFAPLAALAALMVTIDERWDHLKAVRAAGWKAPPDRADLDPAHEAQLLAEAYREAGRAAQEQRRPEEMRHWLGDAEKRSKDLEGVLRLRQAAVDAGAAERAFQAAGDVCMRCHTKYRDVPQD